jgi:hypothetical protein
MIRMFLFVFSGSYDLMFYRSVGLVCRGIVGAYDQYASSIEKQSAFVETQVVQRFQKLIVLLKNERLMMENKFGNAVKHLETCQKNAEKSRKNLLKVNEVAEIMRRSDAHGEFKLQNTITAVLDLVVHFCGAYFFYSVR